MNRKEFVCLVKLLKQDGVAQPVIDLVAFAGGQEERSEGRLEVIMDGLLQLQAPRTSGSTRDINSVRPHPNAIQDPSVRGSVRQKPTELDAPVKKKNKKK